MSAENIDQIAENDLSLELYALPNKPTDAEVNISNSEPLSSLNHSPSARPDVESIISPRNSPKSLSVHDEDDELIEHQAHIADDEATEVNLNSVNDEVQDSTLMQHDSLNNNESSLDVNPNHSESNEITLNNNASKKTKDHSSEKISQFPLGRIKDIMKSDPDINIVSAECVFLIAKATVGIYHI